MEIVTGAICSQHTTSFAKDTPDGEHIMKISYMILDPFGSMINLIVNGEYQ